jgi:hypothetical protein
MPTTTTSQTVLSAIRSAQMAHCAQHHSGALQVDAGCPTCLALQTAADLAQAPQIALAATPRASTVGADVSPSAREVRHGR